MELEEDLYHQSGNRLDAENVACGSKETTVIQAASKDGRSRSNGELSSIKSLEMDSGVNGRTASLGTNGEADANSDIQQNYIACRNSRANKRKCDRGCSRDFAQNSEEFPGSAGDSTYHRSSSCEENCHVPCAKINNNSYSEPSKNCDSNNIELDRVCAKYKSCQRDKLYTENNFSLDPVQTSTPGSGTSKICHNSRTARKSSGLSKTCGILGACAMLGACSNPEVNESLESVLPSEPCVSSGSSEAPESSRTSYKNNSGAPDSSEKDAKPENSNIRPDINTADASSDNDTDESSSDMGNDELSIGSEDSLLYNYRSQWLVDIPNLEGSTAGEAEQARPSHLLPGFASLNLQVVQVPGLGDPSFVIAGDAQEGNAPVAGSGHTSPDMDFLEMDFDPGPSYADSSHSSLEVEVDDVEAASAREELPCDRNNRRSLRTRPSPPSSIQFPSPYQDIRQVRSNEQYHSSLHTFAIPLPYQTLTSLEGASGSGHRDLSRESRPQERNITKENTRRDSSPLLAHRNSAGEVIYVRRTTFQPAVTPSVYHHSSSGDVVAPEDLAGVESADGMTLTPSSSAADRLNLSSSYYHASMAKILMVDEPESKFTENKENSNLEGSNSKQQEAEAVGRHMLWLEREASERQITQIGTSACGATAVINALSALSVSVDAAIVSAAINTRLRANTAPLPAYLLSRSVAGCTADQLLIGLSQNGVSARFFPTFPERVVSLSHWLAYWISLGGVPILTLNLQAGIWNSYQPVADAWHHQMVFGVSARGVYLTNPLQCVSEGVLWHQLVSDSVLLVRSRDLTCRWDANTDLNPLVRVPGDDRWRTMNVLGQVVNVIREFVTNPIPDGSTRTQHIIIPAAYRAGVTIATVTGTEAHRRLLKAPELPVRRQN